MLPATRPENTLRALLNAVIEADWHSMPRGDFELMAKALWYGPVEDLAACDDLFDQLVHANHLQAAGRVGYLFELFQTFRCNTPQKFAAMNTLTYQWRDRLSLPRAAKFAAAKTWGLNQNVEHAMSWVLEFQTRHYANSVLGKQSRYFNDL